MEPDYHYKLKISEQGVNYYYICVVMLARIFPILISELFWQLIYFCMYINGNHLDCVTWLVLAAVLNCFKKPATENNFRMTVTERYKRLFVSCRSWIEARGLWMLLAKCLMFRGLSNIQTIRQHDIGTPVFDWATVQIVGHLFGFLLLLISVYVADWWHSRVPLLVYNIDALFVNPRHINGSGDHANFNLNNNNRQNNNNNNRRFVNVNGHMRNYPQMYAAQQPNGNVNNNSIYRGHQGGQMHTPQQFMNQHPMKHVFDNSAMVARQLALIEQQNQQKIKEEKEEKKNKAKLLKKRRDAAAKRKKKQMDEENDMKKQYDDFMKYGPDHVMKYDRNGRKIGEDSRSQHDPATWRQTKYYDS